MIAIFRKFAIALIVLLIWGCSDDPVSPEVQLRQTISDAESSIKARDLSATMGFVHSGYQDQNGFDLRQLRAMLAGYLLRHKSIFVLTKIEKLEIIEGGEARVLLFAGLAGTPQEQTLTFAEWRGDLMRLDLKFIHQDDEWLLTQADWRRAGPEDFIH
ncbi:MAG: hypothetical protein ABW157_19275 [Candidatus Thiodiazotropha sp. LLP2]